MKNEKIYNAITNISDENIRRGEKAQIKLKRPVSKWWLSAVAAVLVFAFTLTGILWPDGETGGGVLSAYAIAEAEYPARDGDVMRGEKLEEQYTQNLIGFYEKLIGTALSGSDTDNGVISPLNVYMALCVLAESTAGESQRQILDVLGYESIEELREGAGKIWNSVYNTHQSATRLLANSVWLDDSVEFDQSTMENIAKYYYASSFSGDLGSADVNKTLQDWVNKNTGNILSEQMKNLSFGAESLYGIVSTVYFKSSWSSRFNRDNSVKRTFYGAAGDEEIYFMHKSTDATYYWSENFSAVCLTMQGGDKMWIILPNEGVTPSELLSDGAALSLMTPAKNDVSSKTLTVNMYIPRFDVGQETELSDVLKSMGITDVFSITDADMSSVMPDRYGQTGVRPYVSKVNHGVRVRIDERGCEGAAYTQIDITDGAAPAPDEKVNFIADRPFIFAVLDVNDMPIFAGIVNNP